MTTVNDASMVPSGKITLIFILLMINI